MTQASKAERSLILAFLVFLGAVPLVDLACHLLTGYLPGRPPFEAQKLDMSLASALSGELETRLEKAWMNHSVFLRGTVGPYNEMVYRLTKRLPPAVRVGEEKWLFSPGRGNELSAAVVDRQIKANVEVLKSVERRLRKMNAHLIVALIPNRSRMYPEHYYRNGEISPNRRHYLSRLTKALNKRGVESYDLSEPLLRLKASGVPISNPDDHHWNAFGAEAAGLFLAEKVRARLRGTQLHEPPYRVKWGKRSSKASQLNKLGFIPGSQLERSFRARERFAKFKTLARGQGQYSAEYWSTSFGQYGSPEFFANAVRRRVHILQSNGRGSAWTIKAGALDKIPKRSKKDGPYFVIWEIPEYHTISTAEDGAGYLEEVRRYLKKGEPKPPRRQSRRQRSKRGK